MEIAILAVLVLVVLVLAAYLFADGPRDEEEDAAHEVASESISRLIKHTTPVPLTKEGREEENEQLIEESKGEE